MFVRALTQGGARASLALGYHGATPLGFVVEAMALRSVRGRWKVAGDRQGSVEVSTGKEAGEPADTVSRSMAVFGGNPGFSRSSFTLG